MVYHDTGRKNLEHPKVFEPNDWMNCEKTFYTNLDTILNTRVTPLTHVIRKGNRPADDVISIDEECFWNASLQGPAFNFDNNTVIIFLKDLCNGTNADNLINGI